MLKGCLKDTRKHMKSGHMERLRKCGQKVKKLCVSDKNPEHGFITMPLGTGGNKDIQVINKLY